MHHADLDVDVTTGARFHPHEVLLSLGIKFLVIVPLGTPPLAVLLFEIVLNATSMFNHSNVRVPPVIERLLRWIPRSFELFDQRKRIEPAGVDHSAKIRSIRCAMSRAVSTSAAWLPGCSEIAQPV